MISARHRGPAATVEAPVGISGSRRAARPAGRPSAATTLRCRELGAGKAIPVSDLQCDIPERRRRATTRVLEGRRSRGPAGRA